MIQIPAFLVFASVVAVLGLVGSLITAVYRLSKRVATLESWHAEVINDAAALAYGRAKPPKRP